MVRMVKDGSVLPMRWFKAVRAAVAIDQRLKPVLPLEPTPFDDTISKRTFETQVQDWVHKTERVLNKAVLGWLHNPGSRTDTDGRSMYDDTSVADQEQPTPVGLVKGKVKGHGAHSEA